MSCNTTKQVTFTQNDLSGTWRLKTLNGQDANTLFARSLPTLQFDFKDKIIFGTGGCNRYTGRFIMINNLLESPNIASTRMFCMDPNAEDEFFKALRENKSLSLKDGILQMSDSKRKVVLEFERVADNKQAISSAILGGTWYLTKLGNQMATTIFNSERSTVPTVTFDLESKKITGTAGCNRLNTSFMLEESNIQIAPAVTTRMACPNLEGESMFLQAFRGAFQPYMPDTNTLQLLRDGQVVLEFKRGEKSTLEIA